jgi:hypothetical protein
MMRGGQGTHIHTLHSHVAHPSHKVSALHSRSSATHLHVSSVHVAKPKHGAGYHNFLLGNGKAYTF